MKHLTCGHLHDGVWSKTTTSYQVYPQDSFMEERFLYIYVLMGKLTEAPMFEGEIETNAFVL